MLGEDLSDLLWGLDGDALQNLLNRLVLRAKLSELDARYLCAGGRPALAEALGVRTGLVTLVLDWKRTLPHAAQRKVDLLHASGEPLSAAEVKLMEG